MATLFIADLHLSESRPDILAAFERFIERQIRGIDALYVLGDLFEAWIGDDDQSVFNQQVKALFQRVAMQRVPMYFIHGNRDFLIGQRFANETGMQLLPEQQVIELYGTPTLIMHGDTLCTDDEAYQKFRKRSRSLWWQRMILSLPLIWRRKIAKNARQRSMQANQYKSEAIMDVNQLAVERAMRDTGVQRLIHGHTHRPAIHEFSLADKAAQRIVLGDWYEQGSWLVVTPDAVRLENTPL